MKWNLSFPKSPMPMYYLAKVCGLAPITLKNGRFYSGKFLDKLYPLSLAGFYLLTIGFQLFGDRKYSDKIAGLTPFKLYYFNFYVIVCHLIIIIIPTTLVIMCDKIVSILNRLRSVTVELKHFGIQEDLGIFFRKIFKTTVLANGLICSTITVTTLHGTPITLSKFVLDVHNTIVLNTMLIYVYVMLCIKCRFALVNEKLVNVFENVKQQKPTRRRKRTTVSVLNADLRNELTHLECIRKIEKLHDELCDLVEDTTDVFGVSILGIVFKMFVLIVGQSHYIYYQLIRISNGIAASAVTSASMRDLYPLTYMILQSATLFSVCRACETTCEKGNHTKLVLSQVWNKFKPVELEKEFVMFSLQLQHRHLEISACGFFHLNYSTLYKVLCAAITYFIVVIQFDTP